MVLLRIPLCVLMVSQGEKEPRNLALAVYICCFGLSSIPSLERPPPHTLWFVKLSINVLPGRDDIIHTESPTGLTPGKQALSEGGGVGE